MLILCPECNTKVSDKAQACPQCGFRIDSLITCPDCGKLVRPGTMVCPGCAYPFAQKASESPGINGLPDSPSTAQPRKPVAPTESNAGRRPGNNADYPKWQYRESGVTSSVLVSTNEILRRIADGRMLRTVEVWTKGAEKWRPASNYVALSAESTSKVVSAQAAKSQQPAKNEVVRGTKRVWYYAVNGLVYGPASANDVYGRMLDGRVPPNVSIWRKGSSDWAPTTDYVLFGKEEPDAADVMEQDSLLESDALPPMVSLDLRTKYAFATDPDSSIPGSHSAVVVPGESVGSLVLKIIGGLALLNALLFPFGYFMGKISVIGGLVLVLAAVLVFAWVCLQSAGLAGLFLGRFNRRQ